MLTADSRQPTASPRPYFILSIDGGGLRGIMAARWLDHLYTVLIEKGQGEGFAWEGEAPAEPSADSQQLIADSSLLAGTSTGGIIALGLAAGLVPNALVELYATNARAIFKDSRLDNIRDLGGLIGAQYTEKHLRRVLDHAFGGTTLQQLRTRVLIPAFDLDRTIDGRRSWGAKFFHNFPGADSDGDCRVADVALYTSAAPTYFPAVDGYVDGGVVCNNPSVAALAQAIDPRFGGQQLENVWMLSLGTGNSPQYIKGGRLDWGYAHWARPLVNMMIDGAMDIADYQCRQILGDRYCRVQLDLARPVAMDNPDEVKYLLKVADHADLRPAQAFLAAFAAARSEEEPQRAQRQNTETTEAVR